MKALLAMLMVASLVGSVQADDLSDGGNGNGRGGLTIEDLRRACLKPSEFQNQLPPTKIKVKCENTELTWKRVEDGEANLPLSRQIVTQVRSDKYRVKSFKKSYPDSMRVKCPVYKQYKEEFQVEKDISCKLLTSFEGDLRQLCMNIIEENIDPDFVKATETGRRVNFCN